MFRMLLPFAKAYAIAVLPIALVLAGISWIEALTTPYVPLSDQEWEIRFSVGEVFVMSYIVAFAYTLPIFFVLRWIASKLGWLNYRAAVSAGLFAGLSFPIQGVLFNNLGQNQLGMIVPTFGGLGALCGAVYWWVEKRGFADPDRN